MLSVIRKFAQVDSLTSSIGPLMQEVYMLAVVLRKLMDDRGITIQELARKSGVPKTNISSWLQGSSPNIEQLDKIARFMGVSIEYLAFGREGRDPLKEFFERVEIFKGEYEICVKKLVRKK